jgi:tetratricopeptide (TPR) repeat protein
MNLIKTALLFTLLILSHSILSAQDVGLIRTAFSESYKQELLKNYPAAIKLLEKIYEDKYEVNLRLGWLYYMDANYPSSVDYYQRAINQKPDAIEAKQGLMLPLVMLANWDRVLKLHEDIIQIDPFNSTANYWAGVITYNRKKYDVAVKYFEKVVKLYPFGYDANHMLAWTYLNLGRMKDAKNHFTMALLITPDDASSKDGLAKIK